MGKRLLRWTPKKRYLTLAVSLVLLAWLFVHTASGYPESPNAPPHQPGPFTPALLSKTPQPRPKVFVIGLSKTGTTSLGDALSRLSFRRMGWQDVRSRFLFRSYLNHDLAPLVSVTYTHDAFEDLPWALVYQDMAELYPDAKFILTLRNDEQAWLRSITEHTARRKWSGHTVVYGAVEAKDHEDAYLKTYRSHTSSVRDFFAGAGNETRLLEWVVDGRDGEEDEQSWDHLLQFLDMNYSEEAVEELGEFPWSNRTASWRDSYILKTIWQTWDRVMYCIEDTLLGVYQLLTWLTNDAI